MTPHTLYRTIDPPNRMAWYCISGVGCFANPNTFSQRGSAIFRYWYCLVAVCCGSARRIAPCCGRAILRMTRGGIRSQDSGVPGQSRFRGQIRRMQSRQVRLMQPPRLPDSSPLRGRPLTPNPQSPAHIHPDNRTSTTDLLLQNGSTCHRIV